MDVFGEDFHAGGETRRGELTAAQKGELDR
jgi:hypothetical protein